MILGADGKPMRSFASGEHAFDAARRMKHRGYFFFPDLEPSAQMPRWTRVEINKKVNWLYNNVGAVRMVVDGLSLDEVDTGIWPKATTSNSKFNKAVTDDFHEQWGELKVFDLAAQENFYSAQFAIRRNIRLYGDMFGLLARPRVDGGLPAMSFVPMWGVGNANTPADQSAWEDGVLKNAQNRAVKYRILKTRDGKEWEDFEAQDVQHYHDAFWPGQVRGMSGLASVARKLFTIDDIEKAESAGFRLRSRIAYAITRSDEDDGAPPVLPGAGEVETVEASDGAQLEIQKIVSSAGDEVSVANLPAGYEVKLLESAKATSGGEFITSLMRDVAYSQLYPPEWVFFVSGLGAGTVFRGVQNRVQRVINSIREFQLIPQFVKPAYVFWLWQRIKAGAYEDVGVPPDWWRRKFITPGLMTVDLAREGALFDRRLESGKMSPARYHGIQGEDDDEVEDEIIAAFIRRQRKLEEARAANPDLAAALNVSQVFPPPTGSVQPVEDLPQPDDDEEPEEKKENE